MDNLAKDRHIAEKTRIEISAHVKRIHALFGQAIRKQPNDNNAFRSKQPQRVQEALAIVQQESLIEQSLKLSAPYQIKASFVYGTDALMVGLYQTTIKHLREQLNDLKEKSHKNNHPSEKDIHEADQIIATLVHLVETLDTLGKTPDELYNLFLDAIIQPKSGIPFIIKMYGQLDLSNDIDLLALKQYHQKAHFLNTVYQAKSAPDLYLTSVCEALKDCCDTAKALFDKNKQPLGWFESQTSRDATIAALERQLEDALDSVRDVLQTASSSSPSHDSTTDSGTDESDYKSKSDTEMDLDQSPSPSASPSLTPLRSLAVVPGLSAKHQHPLGPPPPPRPKPPAPT